MAPTETTIRSRPWRRHGMPNRATSKTTSSGSDDAEDDAATEMEPGTGPEDAGNRNEEEPGGEEDVDEEGPGDEEGIDKVPSENEAPTAATTSSKEELLEGAGDEASIAPSVRYCHPSCAADARFVRCCGRA
jgi:hypothetical protein